MLKGLLSVGMISLAVLASGCGMDPSMRYGINAERIAAGAMEDSLWPQPGMGRSVSLPPQGGEQDMKWQSGSKPT